MYTAKHTGRNRVCLPDEMEEAPLKEDKNLPLPVPQYSEQNILQTITTMATFHDHETQAHAYRMMHLAEATMRALGRSEDEITLLRQGYPYGLTQQEIPLRARILSVIDSYDAMTSARPYQKTLSTAEARAELQHGAGTQFDPQVVDALLQVLEAQEQQLSFSASAV